MLKKVKIDFEKNFGILLIFLIFYLTILIGFYLNEDNLGGAIKDSVHHFKIVEKFNDDFLGTLKNFGDPAHGIQTRNSPVFWMFLSVFSEYLSFENIRLINTLISILIVFTFYKCLTLKFKDQNNFVLVILSSSLFLSPTLRSLAIWPYSLVWGLFFLLISIYFFLKFNESICIKKSFLILFFTILSAYFYPSFSVFYIYFLIKIYKNLTNKKLILILLFLSVLLSLPAIYYIISKNVIYAFQTSQGLETSILETLNLSNKILIIGTIFLYLILPVVNFKKIYLEIKNFNLLTILFISTFCFINIYFFNFPDAVWGGGFFHKLSNLLFDNNYFFFISAFISFLIIYSMMYKNLNNLVLLVLLVIYNPQFTIYIKYFDPLIFIIFFTLFDLDFKNHFFNRKSKYIQLYLVFGFYYLVIFGKQIIA